LSSAVDEEPFACAEGTCAHSVRAGRMSRRPVSGGRGVQVTSNSSGSTGLWAGSWPSCWNRSACSGKVNADSRRSRRCPMLSTDIALVFYRSDRGSVPATRTTDIPEREHSQGQRSSHTQCDARKRRKSCHSNSDEDLPKRPSVFRLNTILVHVFSCGSQGCQTIARQNAFLYGAISLGLP
jgi:hypothetical protein